MAEKIIVKYRKPTLEEYVILRKAAGWGVPPEEAIQASIKNASFSVCLEKDGEMVGLGRVVGDNGIYFYVQDIIVLPAFRGQGYSKIIMDEVIQFLKNKVTHGAFIGLFSVKGVEGLYEKYGFRKRPGNTSGAGMFLPVSELMAR